MSDAVDYEARLKELAALGDDWNTYGSEAPSSESIELARRFLSVAKESGLEPDRVSPSAEGGAAVSFRDGRKFWMTEFFNDGDVSSVWSDEEGHVDAKEVSEPTDAGFRAEIARVKEFFNG